MHYHHGMSTNESLLDCLLELQTLDRVSRSGYALRGVPAPESVSEHVFHLIFLVWVLGRDIEHLDRAHAMELALVHDLAEARFGDLPRTAAKYLPAGAKARAERQAFAELLAPLADDSVALLDEYQSRSTVEARFVAVCDKLQILLKATVYQRWGAGDLDEFFSDLEAFDVGGFEPVAALVEELRARRACAE